MRHQLCVGAIAVAFLGVGFAAAQTSAPSQTPGAALNLSPEQGRAVADGLKSEKPQASSTASNTQRGSRAPNDVTTKPLPSSVAAQVPSTRELLFVKLPDRVLLIDPNTNMVAEIIPMDSSTTGSGDASGSSAPAR
jgi:hypothetical protein